jgi:hypothetical protein
MVDKSILSTNMEKIVVPDKGMTPKTTIKSQILTEKL